MVCPEMGQLDRALSIASMTMIAACAAGGMPTLEPDASALVPHDAGSARDAGERLFDADVLVAIDAASVAVDAGDSSRFDAGLSELDAESLDSDAGDTDAGAIDAGVIDAGPTTPAPPGSYTYSRVPVTGLDYAVKVAFHPSGSYAILVGGRDELFVYDWETRTSTRCDFTPTGGAHRYFADIAFDALGDSATIVGREGTTSFTGIAYRFDHAVWRTLGDCTAFARLTLTPSPIGQELRAIGYSSTSSDPIVLTNQNLSGGFYVARLRQLSSTGVLTDVSGGTTQAAGCEDIAFAENVFGEPGIVVACGQNGGTVLFWDGEWRDGFPSFGNTSAAANHPSHGYALIVSWAGDDLVRFDRGGFSGDPSISLAGDPQFIVFQPSGQRALILGRRFGTAGTVLEYRHDLFAAEHVHDVSIPGFDASPYFATTNTYLFDAAFRPGCDGGLVVGGETFGAGLAIEFAIAPGIPCRAP